MSWTAFYQADGEMRHTIAKASRRHTVEYERDEFILRMLYPKRGVWFTWVESDTGEVTPTMTYTEWRREKEIYAKAGDTL